MAEKALKKCIFLHSVFPKQGALFWGVRYARKYGDPADQKEREIMSHNTESILVALAVGFSCMTQEITKIIFMQIHSFH